MNYTSHVFEAKSVLCQNMPMLCIADIRKSRGLTQVQLAEKVGISQAHISRLENGDDSVSLKLLAELAQALGVRPSDLLMDRSAKEQILIEAYRSASPEIQAMMLGMVQASKIPSKSEH